MQITDTGGSEKVCDGKSLQEFTLTDYDLEMEGAFVCCLMTGVGSGLTVRCRVIDIVSEVGIARSGSRGFSTC